MQQQQQKFMDGGKHIASSSAPAPQKEKRKQRFLNKIIQGDQVTKSSSFQKRLPTVKKKALQLQTLAGVSVCVVSTDGVSGDGNVQILWPEDPVLARQAIESYRNADKKKREETTLLKFFEKEIVKYEKKIEKKKLKALEKRLSNWIDGLEGDGDALADAVGRLDSKIAELEAKIRDSGVEEREGIQTTESDEGGSSSSPQSTVENRSSGGVLQPSPLAWIPENNNNCGGESSNLAQAHQAALPSLPMIAADHRNEASMGDEYLTAWSSFTDGQSTLFHNGGENSNLAQTYQELPSLPTFFDSDHRQEIETVDENCTWSSFADGQSTLFHNGSESLDLAQTYQELPSLPTYPGSDQRLKSPMVDEYPTWPSFTDGQGTLFHNYGSNWAGPSRPQEPLPLPAWWARQFQTEFGGNGQSGGFSY